MALKKFIKIENVGRLATCSQKGPELNRYNLIFAENGRGKTTLCSVLRSLETSQPEHLIERRTFSPTAGDPIVEIRQDGGDAKYQKGAWNRTNTDIVIFDSTFVARNVHAGEYIDRSHRTNLLQVIIGEAGINLAEAVNKLDGDIREINSKIAAAKKAIESQNLNGTKLADFLKIQENEDVDNQIKEKQTQQNAVAEAQVIKTRAALRELKIPALPTKLISVLGKVLEDIEKDAEEKTKKQISKHDMHDGGEEWLSKGNSYTKNDSCPFCGQNVKENDLLKSYKQYFSESYGALKAEANALIDEIDENIGSKYEAQERTVEARNSADAEFWKKHISFQDITLDFDNDIVEPLKKIALISKNLLEQKLSKPLEAIVPTNDFEQSNIDLEKIAASITTYNAKILSINVTIEGKRTATATSNASTVAKDLSDLTMAKLRHSASVNTLCTEYQDLIKAKTLLDNEKEKAKDALDAHADVMIKEYQTTINNILSGFGAGFSLTNSKKTYSGGTPTSAYQILINDQAVDLGDDSTPIGQPSFRTTLSAGDKSTLALAFFLAKLDHDPLKTQRIIVFDDPFNSQDRSRRERTAELLKKYGGECQQMILLSHDPHFLSLVHTKLLKKETHCLQLSRVPSNVGVVVGGYSTIEEWDVDQETMDGYFKEHAALTSYIINGAKDHVDIVRKIRPVLEGYLRYRFPNQFPANEWLGDMIGRVRNDNSHPIHSINGELADINDYSKKYHHDTNPGKADSEIIDDGELQTYVTRALRIVGGY